MLDIAITFIVDELNSYLRTRGVFTQHEDMVVPGPLVNDKGEWAVAEGKIGLTLIGIEEERVLREQLPERTLLNGNHITLQPPLKLNLNVLFSVRSGTAQNAYATSLKSLSHVLTFFQTRPSFASDSYPGLDSRIVKLNAELLSYGPEQLNQTWAYLGSKYLPSAIYRIRMVVLQDAEPMAIDKPVSTLSTKVGSL